MSEITQFNSRLSKILLALVFVLGARLVVFAMQHNNWKGALVSFFHLAIVAVASFFFLRKSGNRSQE